MLLLDFLLDLDLGLRWCQVRSVIAQALTLQILDQLVQSKHEFIPCLLIVNDENAKCQLDLLVCRQALFLSLL